MPGGRRRRSLERLPELELPAQDIGLGKVKRIDPARILQTSRKGREKAGQMRLGLREVNLLLPSRSVSALSVSTRT